MTTSRKKPLTELEKLNITNCVGRRYVSSRCVTPDSKKNEISNASKTSFIDTSGIQRNLADSFNDEDISISDYSSFDCNDDVSTDAEEEIIKCLPEDEITKEITNEDGMDAIFTTEVVEKLQHNEIREVSNEFENLFVSEDVYETCHEIAGDSQFKDVPSVLVDDDDSVLFPCDNTGNVEKEMDKTQYEIEMEKICEENKSRVRLCKTLLGNGIIDIFQLETKISSNLLCSQCVTEKKWDSMGSATEDITAECAIVVRAVHRGFACTLTVQCVRKHHMFSVEPERLSKEYSVLDPVDSDNERDLVDTDLADNCVAGASGNNNDTTDLGKNNDTDPADNCVAGVSGNNNDTTDLGKNNDTDPADNCVAVAIGNNNNTTDLGKNKDTDPADNCVTGAIGNNNDKTDLADNCIARVSKKHLIQCLRQQNKNKNQENGDGNDEEELTTYAIMRLRYYRFQSSAF